MPLSTFLMIHGCSTTEIAREGMGSHGADWLSAAMLAASGWVSIAEESARKDGEVNFSVPAITRQIEE